MAIECDLRKKAGESWFDIITTDSGSSAIALVRRGRSADTRGTFNYKPRGGQASRFSLDAEVGRPIKGKTEAEKFANDFRAAINNGTFVRAAERRRFATVAPAPDAGAVTLDIFATTYMDRHAKVSGKKTWSNDEYMFARLREFVLPDGSRLGLKALSAITEDDLEAFHAHLRGIGRAASTSHSGRGGSRLTSSIRTGS